MALTITVFTENTGSRRGGTDSISRSYTVAGVDGSTPMTETQCMGYIDDSIGVDIPATINTLGISDVSYQESDSIDGQFIVTVTWNIPTAEVGYRFNYQAHGGHFVQSLQTISAWGRGLVGVTTQPLDLAAAHLPNFGGAINVVPQEDGPPKVEGMDVQPPPETFTLTYWAYDAEINPTYQELVYNLCGKVNNAEFNNLDAGTTMLVRVNGERRKAPHSDHVWQIEFGFGYIPNATGVVIGNGISYGDKITVSAKDGLDLLWVYREQEKESDYGIIRPLPIAAYVERVWERADLNDLNLPGI